MKDDSILNWRNWPVNKEWRWGHSVANRSMAVPLPDRLWWFGECLHISCLSEQLHEVWFELLFTDPSHRDFLFETTNLFVLRKQSHGLWNPAISLAPFQLHVLPLETGSSIRGEKCKWNASPIFFFFLLKFREISGAEESSGVSYVYYSFACVSEYLNKSQSIQIFLCKKEISSFYEDSRKKWNRNYSLLESGCSIFVL